MLLIAFVLAVAGAALSLIYSGALSMILQHGADLAWLKDFTNFSPEEMCVLGSTALSALGALIALFGKKIAALPMLVAAGILAYAEVKLGAEFPYCRAAAVMFAAAGLFVLFSRSDSHAGEETEPDEVTAEEGPIQAPAEQTAVGSEPASEAVAEAEPKPAEVQEPVLAVASPSAETACNCRFKIMGIVLGLIAAAYPLYMTGLWKLIPEYAADVAKLGDAASLECGTKAVLAVAVASVLGGIFASVRCGLGTALFVIATAISGAIYVRYPYDYSLAGAIICAVAAIYAWFATVENDDRAFRRYTCAYPYSVVFALAAVAVAMRYSGIGCDVAAGKVSLDYASVMAMALQAKSVVVICFCGLIGAVFALFGVRLGGLFLLVSLFGSIAAELLIDTLYPYSWVSLLLFAVSAMLASSYESSASEKKAAPKRLTAHATFLVIIAAAAVGAALAWGYFRTEFDKKLLTARNDDPAYLKLASDLEAKDARIAEISAEADAQVALTAERDVAIADLKAQIAAKDAERAEAAEKTTALEASNAELLKQLEEANAGLAEAKAAANKKYVYLQGSANVRDKPSNDKSSKVIGRLNNETAEILDAKKPSGSTAYWYKVKCDFGTGWVFGKNAIVIRPKK